MKELSSDDTEKSFDVLYRYIANAEFIKKYKHPHPDPNFEEWSYGEGGGFSSFVWNNIGIGSRIFFHSTIGGSRYLTGMLVVSEMAPGSVWRLDPAYSSKYLNPHFHPEKMYDLDMGNHEFDLEVKKVWDEGQIPRTDVILLGDQEKSMDIRNEPVVLEKEILSKLDMLGKPIKWNISDKHGRLFDDKRCIHSCLRTPRLLSHQDGDYLEQIISKKAGSFFTQKECYVSLGTEASAEIQAQCHTEADIEKYLIANLNRIDDKLKFVSNQQILPDRSRLDIVAKYDDRNYVIIEIKKGTASDDTLAQLLSYLNLYRKDNGKVNISGIIVCQDASYRLKNACEHVEIKIHYYGDILFKNI